MLVSISEGCLPTNRVWYVDLHSLPGSAKGQPLDFAPYDFHSGQKPLPLVKLVDNFEAQYEYVANSGTEFTFQTNYKAPLYRCVMPLGKCCCSAVHSFPPLPVLLQAFRRICSQILSIILSAYILNITVLASAAAVIIHVYLSQPDRHLTLQACTDRHWAPK